MILASVNGTKVVEARTDERSIEMVLKGLSMESLA